MELEKRGLYLPIERHSGVDGSLDGESCAARRSLCSTAKTGSEKTKSPTSAPRRLDWSFARFLMRGGSADELGLFYWRTFNLHCLVRGALFRDWVDPHGTSDFGRFIDCVNYPDIGQSFIA